MNISWNRVKVIATAGPACLNYKTLRAMIIAGLDIVRINFSHGNRKEYLQIIKLVRKVEGEIKRPVGILADMPGPKLRVRNEESVQTKTGGTVKLVSGAPQGENEVAVSHPVIIKCLKKGDMVYVSDGKIRLRVEKAGKSSAECKVTAGGEIKKGAGLNFPGVDLPVPAVTHEDYGNIRFAAASGVDFIGLSFVKEAADIVKVKKFILKLPNKPFIVAKIERHFAIDNLDSIVEATDGVMVARGDLGVEMPIERIAIMQKEIIAKCNAAGKPVITATQMLESMIENPSPTRAESSDVANAIFDGTDAVMLSGETAVGKYPLEAVKMMVKIAKTSEKRYHFNRNPAEVEKGDLYDIISRSVAGISLAHHVKAIIVPTLSGKTARVISKRRPSAIIIALAAKKNIQRQLTLSWGVYPDHMEHQQPSKVLRRADDYIRRSELLKKGDRIIVTAGILDKKRNFSNIIKISEV